MAVVVGYNNDPVLCSMYSWKIHTETSHRTINTGRCVSHVLISVLQNYHSGMWRRGYKEEVHCNQENVMWTASEDPCQHFSSYNGNSVGRDSSVGIATRYRLDGTRIKSWWGRDFPHLSRPALGPSQPPIRWVPGLFPLDKASGVWSWPPTLI